MKQPPAGFSVYDYSAPVNEEEIIRTARPVKVKGFSVSGLLREAAAQGKPLPDAPTFLAFKDYPIQESLAISFRVARHLYPNVPMGQAMRLLGHRAFGSFMESMVGRALFGLPGIKIEHSIRLVPRAYSIVVPSGKVTFSSLTEDSVVLSFRDFPTVLNSYEIGVFEGAFLSRSVPCDVYIKQLGFGDADFFLTWRV